MANSGSRKNVIFVGLMLGMLVAAVSQTIVSPAMPVIVSELGGIEHYSWIATSALLVSAVTVPVIGKLSDIYVNLPFGVAALAFIVAYLHVPHVPRRHRLDYVGFAALPVALVAVLLATTWGGTTYPWGSWQIASLYAAGVLVFVGFLINEYYAEEPVLPLRLWKNSVFTLSNVSNMAIAMTMFGAIFFIPVYAQGVIGVNVTNSGAVLIPLTASMIVVSIVVGRLITRTGRYKGFMLAGLLVMMSGYFLLTSLGYGSTQTDLSLDMIVVGLGLGVATSTTQLSRSLGATLGTAIFGTIMINGMKTEIPKHLPPQALQGPQAAELSDGSGVGAVLDPNTLGQLPDAVASGIREGLAAAMHPVFVAGLPIIGIAFFATLFIKELPLRTVAFADIASDAAEPGEAESSEKEVLLRSGLTVAYLSRLVESRRWSSPELLRAASQLVERNGETSVRERALRANEEVLEPLARGLLSSYLHQGREPDPEGERGSRLREHATQAGERSGQEDRAIRRRVS
jgi:MFS family permease